MGKEIDDEDIQEDIPLGSMLASNSGLKIFCLTFEILESILPNLFLPKYLYFYAIKLGHFIVRILFFQYVTNTQN